MIARFIHWRRKRKLRKRGISVAWTDPQNPKKDWKPPKTSNTGRSPDET